MNLPIQCFVLNSTKHRFEHTHTLWVAYQYNIISYLVASQMYMVQTAVGS